MLLWITSRYIKNQIPPWNLSMSHHQAESPCSVTLVSSFSFAADISPADAPNTAVQWSLTEPDGASTTLAEIDENGMVTVTGEGSGTLVATAASVFDPDCKNTMELDLQITEQGAKKLSFWSA